MSGRNALSSLKKELEKKIRYLLLFITIAFLLLTLVKSFYLTKKFGGTDLRCRVVGSRLITTTHSPYYYKWNPADGEFYLDPNDQAKMSVNGNSVTPATLAIMYPVAMLPYRDVRMIWTILQWLAAAAIIFLLFKSRRFENWFLVAAPIIIGFICCDLWLYNIERGQMYIFYALLLSLMYRFYISEKKWGVFVSGFIAGLFILFRPFAIIMGLGFLLTGKKKWIIGCITGGLVGVLVFVVPFQKAWKDYFPAMQEYVKQNVETAKYNTAAIEPVKPAIIEGQDNLTQFRYFYISRLDTTYHFLKRFGIIITTNQSLFAFALLIAVFSIAFYRLRKKIASTDGIFLFGFSLFLLSELFIPAPRGSYNMILWIFPITLIYLRWRTNYPLLMILGTALLLFHSFPFVFPHQEELAELILLLVTIFTVFFPSSVKKLEHGIS